MIDVFDVHSWMYSVGAVFQVLVFILLPFIPYFLHRALYRDSVRTKSARVCEAYLLFSFVFIFLIIKTFSLSPSLLTGLIHDPLLIARVVNIQNVMSGGL